MSIFFIDFFNGVITALEGERIAIQLDDGAELVALQSGDWHEDQRIEVVVRAQKFDLFPMNHQEKEADTNYFDGRIKARSYMGGEVRYFAETTTGTTVHMRRYGSRRDRAGRGRRRGGRLAARRPGRVS